MATYSDLAKQFWTARVQSAGFCKTFANMVIADATESKITAELTVTSEMTNSLGRLHGGAIATIIDVVSSVGLHASCERSAVTINLNINYQRMAKVGDIILVESEITKQGKTIAFMDIKLKQKDDGAIVAHGTHVKSFI